MSERIIKWGFIGCGEVTKYKSGPAFQKIENSEVVAVMSRNGDKAKTYAKERGIPKWYDDAQELSERRVHCHSSFFTCYVRHHVHEGR